MYSTAVQLLGLSFNSVIWCKNAALDEIRLKTQGVECYCLCKHDYFKVPALTRITDCCKYLCIR
jgi:hypothetical protein